MYINMIYNLKVLMYFIACRHIYKLDRILYILKCGNLSHFHKEKSRKRCNAATKIILKEQKMLLDTISNFVILHVLAQTLNWKLYTALGKKHRLQLLIHQSNFERCIFNVT